MLLVHSLEKGMCFPNPRPFGFDKVSELMNLLSRYSEEQKCEFEYQLGVSVLFAWMDFFEKQGWQKEIAFVKHCCIFVQMKGFTLIILTEDADMLKR